MDPVTAPTLFVVLSDVTAAHEDEFNRWYDEEHVPERLSAPGFLRATRYRAVPELPGGATVQGEAQAPRYLAIYEVSGPEALQTDEYRRQIANHTEWTRRTQEHMQVKVRHTYQRMGDVRLP